jgi:hypothetical protein
MTRHGQGRGEHGSPKRSTPPSRASAAPAKDHHGAILAVRGASPTTHISYRVRCRALASVRYGTVPRCTGCDDRPQRPTRRHHRGPQEWAHPDRQLHPHRFIGQWSRRLRRHAASPPALRRGAPRLPQRHDRAGHRVEPGNRRHSRLRLGVTGPRRGRGVSGDGCSAPPPSLPSVTGGTAGRDGGHRVHGSRW